MRYTGSRKARMRSSITAHRLGWLSPDTNSTTYSSPSVVRKSSSVAM